MLERLSVDPVGLNAAAVSLEGEARDVSHPRAAALVGDKPSVAGAADVRTAVEAFTAAYGFRLTRHSVSIIQAAACYSASDENAALNISLA